MKKIIIIVLVFGLTACSFMYDDNRKPADTWWTVERARTFKDGRTLERKAESYENILFWRFFPADYFYTEIRLDDPSDMYGYTSTYTEKGFADAAAYGGRLFAAMAMKYHLKGLNGGTPSYVTNIRLHKTAYFINTLCNIAEPGLVVRGYKSYNGEELEENWHVGTGKYASYQYRSDSSPAQISGVVTGMLVAYLCNIPEYMKAQIREDMRNICNRLIRDNWTILDIDGKRTKVSEFDPRDPLLLLGSPWTGYLGLYLIAELTPGGKTAYDLMAGSRAVRNVTLLKILYAGMFITQDAKITANYINLCQKGYAKRAQNAAINFFGVFNAGDEASKIEDFFCLLLPQTLFAISDEEYQDHYKVGIQKSWHMLKDMQHLPATVQYSYVRGIWDKERIDAALAMLDTFPTPKRRCTIVNSNRKDIKLYLWAELDKSPEALCRVDSILPFYERKVTSYVWIRDLRAGIDPEGDGTREFSYVDWLYAYWLYQWLEVLK